MEDRLVHNISTETSPDGIFRSACFSLCRTYRYSLTRAWGEGDTVAALELAAIPLLAENWRTTLTHRANKQETDSQKRLIGENEWTWPVTKTTPKTCTVRLANPQRALQ